MVQSMVNIIGEHVFACWRVVSEYPASDRECARNGFAIIIPFLTVSGSLLLCAHLVICLIQRLSNP